MQHGLLALAIALILAIVAALFAPAYVDWNEWRATFERQASELAGTPVKIRGPIEATILPTPAFLLRDVRIGDPEHSTGIHAGEVQGSLSLGSLLRGAFQAEDFALVRPSMRIALAEGGRMVLPDGAAKGSDALSISRFSISNGSLTIEDRTAGALTFLDGISAAGEMYSRNGPMRLDAGMRLDGRRWNMRVSAGVFGAEGARTRFSIERLDDGASFEADGMLGFVAGLPRFSGRVNLAHARRAEMPWKIAAQVSARGDLVSFDTFDLTLGNSEFPLELAGNLQFVPRRGGAIMGSLNAKRLDLDRALGVKPGEGLAGVIVPLLENFARGGELALKGKLSLAIDLMVANGAQIRDLRGEIGFRNGFLGIDALEAKLPGRAVLNASGENASGYFRGDIKLEAAEPAALMRWAFGPNRLSLPEDTGPSSIAGAVDWSPRLLSVQRLQFTLGDARLGGGFAIARTEEGKSAVRSALTADGVDLDLLRPLADIIRNDSGAADLSLGFRGRSVQLFGRPMHGVDLAISRTVDGFSVERFRVENFGGLKATASGKLDDRIDFEGVASESAGLVTLAEMFGGVDMATAARTLSRNALPVKFSGTVSYTGVKNEEVAIVLKGNLGEVQADASLHYESAQLSLTGAHIRLETDQPGWLANLIGVSSGAASPGTGRFELTLERPKAGVFPLKSLVTLPDARLTGAGELARGMDGRLDPRIDLKLEAKDMRNVLSVVLLSANAPIAAKGSARLGRSGNTFTFENILLEMGKTRTSGRVTFSSLSPMQLSGRLAIDRVELVEMLGFIAGFSGDPKSFWPRTRLGASPIQGVTGVLDLEVAALGLASAHVATAAKFHLKLGDPVEIANFTADYAGGKLAGDAKITVGEKLSFEGRGALNDFDIARTLVPGTGKAQARGRGSLLLSLSGSGATPAALAANLSGQGMLSLENLEIDTLDPTAIATVVAASEKHMPRDEGHLIQGVNSMLARAPLTLQRLETALVAANGMLRTGKAITKAGEVEVTAEASADLARLQFECSIELETADATTARPGLTVRWSGPLGAPDRKLDVSALSTAINLRAMERERKRLEQRDRTALPPPPADRPVREVLNLPPGEEVNALMSTAKLPKRVPLPPLRVQ